MPIPRRSATWTTYASNVWQPRTPHGLADVRKVELKADDEARARRARRPDVDQVLAQRRRGRLHDDAARNVPHRYDELWRWRVGLILMRRGRHPNDLDKDVV